MNLMYEIYMEYFSQINWLLKINLDQYFTNLWLKSVGPFSLINFSVLNLNLIISDACVEVGGVLNNWSTGIACPNCRHQLRVSLAHTKTTQNPISPLTPPFTIQPSFLPHSPLYAAPSPPVISSPYNDELRRLADTLRALRLSGWYYGNLDWQVCLLYIAYKRING